MQVLENLNGCFREDENEMKKFFCLLALTLLLTTPVLAAEKTISATGMYIAGASESLNDAKQNALNDAMRQAAEQAGVLVNSYSKTHNMELTDDEVTILATRIIKITNKNFDVKLISDSEIKVIAYIDVVVNTESINEDIIRLKNKNKELEWQKNQSQEKQRVLHEIDDLNANIVEEYRKRYHVLQYYILYFSFLNQIQHYRNNLHYQFCIYYFYSRLSPPKYNHQHYNSFAYSYQNQIY